MNSASFINWAKNQPDAGLEGLESLDAALSHPQVEALSTKLAEEGAPLPMEAVATLVASLAQLQQKSPVLEKHYRSSGVDFVAVWALASPLRRASEDPNEARFRRWAGAEDWETFFGATIIGVRVLITYRRPFDLVTLFRWVALRSTTPRDFPSAASDAFTTWQAPADWVPEINAARHDPEHCRALIREMLDAGWKRADLGDRLGVTPQYLGLITKGKRSSSYGLQVSLELLCGPADSPTLSKTSSAG